MTPKKNFIKKEQVFNHLNYAGGQYSLWEERTQRLLSSIEYWLIEQTKLRLQKAYKKGQKPEFMPFLTGNKEGLIGNIKKDSFFDIWHSEKRKSTLDKLDVKKCPHLCVGDSLNEFLDTVKKVSHRDFL